MMIHFDAPTATTTYAYVHASIKTRTTAPFLKDELSVALPKTIAHIVIPPPTQPPTADVAYDQLACSDVDKQKITRLISTIAENGKLVLLLKYQRELRQIGREIDHVHPLKFLSTIMSNPTLKADMREIYHDYFKWTNVMDGLGNGLTTQAKQGKVAIYLNEFAKEVGVKPEALQGYVQSQDWENMVVFLMNN
jgi:hypothetical protein